MLFRGLVLFARNAGGKFGKVLKEKSGMRLRRFVLFARNVGGKRENHNKGDLLAKSKWPHVMNSSDTIHGPLVSRTWTWHRQHARWHHGYYRTRR